MAINSNFLRQQVFALLRESTTSAEEDLEALSQCAAHIRNRMIVEGIARDCGLSLTGFLTNDALEMYYDIKRGRHGLGFIAKGWDDPGFRIGDLVEIGPWEQDVFKAHAADLARYCSTRGIAMTLVTKNSMSAEIQMDGVIYSEGFNRVTFQKTLESLNECVEKIHSLIPEGRHDRHLPSGYFGRKPAEASGRSH
jgi:hypothetical protein